MSVLDSEKEELKKLYTFIVESELKPEVKDDNEEEFEEDYVLKKDVEINDLEEQMRYLKLELTNEKLRVIELEEKLEKQMNRVLNNENIINFVKDCIEFCNTPNPFNNDFNNIDINYSKYIIEYGIKFNKFENEYNALINRDICDNMIKETYINIIKRKYDEYKTSYNMMIETLNMRFNRLNYNNFMLTFFAMYFLITIYFYFMN